MNTDNQRPAMWFYIFILSVIIFAIWLGLFKKQVRFINLNSTDQAMTLDQVAQEFKNAVSRGYHDLQVIWPNTSPTLSAATSSATAEQIQLFLEKIKKQLKQNNQK